VIVLDASAATDWLLQTTAGQQIENRIYSRGESLHAPHLLDLEVAEVLRRLVREAAVSAQRADQALQDLLSLRVARYPFRFPAPDLAAQAQLVGLRCGLRCARQQLGTTLTTRDARLAAASARKVTIELF
jgi:predicted nucleic acid-binding protein